MGSRSRVFAALTLAVTPAVTGLTATPSFAADAVQAKGGCWAYVPQAADPEGDEATLLETLQAPVQRDGHGTSMAGAVPLSLDPEGVTLTLESSGGTASGAKRQIKLDVANGPVLDALVDRTGQAHALFAITPPGGVPEGSDAALVVASSDFDVKAGESIENLVLTTTADDSFELSLPGEYGITLQSLFFVAEEGATQLFWTCNAQTATHPTGAGDDVNTPEVENANPATNPIAWESVVDQFVVDEASALTLADIRGQSVNTHVRSGDALVLSTLGMATDTTYRVGFTDGSARLESTEVLQTHADGASEVVDVVVPEGLAPGAGIIQLIAPDESDVGPVLEINVLSEPLLAVSESVNGESLELTVNGSGFDPRAVVRLRSRTDDGAGTDAVMRVQANEQGAFETTYAVSDVDATAVRATQSRDDSFKDLRVVHSLETKVPAPATPPPPAVPSPPPPALVAPPAAAPVVPPPVAIPIPPEAPLTEIPAPPIDVIQEPELKVSEARLEGSVGMAELFGGSSRRSVSFEVENVGTGVAVNPPVLLGVGRTKEAVPGLVATELGNLDPGARVAVDVNVALPMASFGNYQVVGQVGDEAATEFSLRWDTYPWGLIAVNGLGVGLLAWGVSRRRRAAAPLPTGPTVEEAGASVVDLTALDKWWKEGKVVHTPIAPEEDNDSVVDLDAADRWWARNQNKVS